MLSGVGGTGGRGAHGDMVRPGEILGGGVPKARYADIRIVGLEVHGIASGL